MIRNASFRPLFCLLAAGALLEVWPGPARALATANLRSFTNDTGIVILDESAAAPYPSSITVSGMTGVVTRLVVTLRELSHSYPDDLDILLVAPGGKKSWLMSDAGGTFQVANVTIQFEDTAAAIPNSSQIVSGVYAPANWGISAGDTLPAPAPAGPHIDLLGTFNGINPNGAWSLYVRDDIPENDGDIADGWSLSVSTVQTPTSISITQIGTTARLSWPESSPGYTLETRTNLQSSTAWTTATNTVLLTNGEQRATVPLSGPQRFFRLRK